MSFLSPWFLLGGLAVGVPIWLHLIRREQPTLRPFSSLMFLRRMPVKSVSRQRLKYLLLLATRLLIVLLIALAFARPYFPNIKRAFSGGGGQKHVVILLDTSLSMQYGDRWQRAVAAARDAVAGLSERDLAQIVTFAAEYEIRILPTPDKAALRAVIDGGVSPTAAPTSYSQAFRAVEKISEDAQQPLSVILISDLQRSGVANMAQGFPSGPVSDFKLVDVAGKDAASQEAPNWTVAGVRSRRVIYRSRYPDRLLVEVRGFRTPAASKEITLSIDGKTIAKKTVQLAASGSATVAFDSFDVPTGSNRGEIAISPRDGLPQDDVFHFVLERREPYRLLFLREPGDANELYYFRSALAAEADSPFVIDARTPGEAAGVRLRDYATVILSNVSSLPPELASGIRDFVKEGRGLLATLGSRFPAPALEAEWKDLWPGKAVEKRLLTPDRERMVLLGQFEKDHPLFREFQEASAAESLRLAKTYAYLRIEAQGPVLMRFSNGDPALVERNYGQGRALLFASAFDNVWSDFPLHPAFIPLLHQMIRYTSQLSDEPAAYTIPSAVTLSSYKLASGAQAQGQLWDVVGPDGKHEVPLAEEKRPDYLTLRQGGFYELRQASSSHLIAANPDPRESDLTPLSTDDVATWKANAAAKEDAGIASGPEMAQRQNIWWNLLLIAFMLGLAEAYLANRYLGPRGSVAAPEESAYGGGS